MWAVSLTGRWSQETSGYFRPTAFEADSPHDGHVSLVGLLKKETSGYFSEDPQD